MLLFQTRINQNPVMPAAVFTRFNENNLDVNHFVNIRRAEARSQQSVFALNIHRAIYSLYYIRHLELLRYRNIGIYQTVISNYEDTHMTESFALAAELEYWCSNLDPVFSQLFLLYQSMRLIQSPRSS